MENIRNMDKVSSYQIVLLLTIYRVITALTYLPIINVPPGNQDMWIVFLLSIVYTIIFCIPILYLSNKFNSLNLIGYAEQIMGKVLGKIIGMFYAIVLFLALNFFAASLIEIINITLFPQTSTYMTISIILGTCIYIVYKGFKNISRLGEITNPIILIAIFLFIVLGFADYKPEEILPILADSTFKDINIGAINIALRFSEIMILAMATPYLRIKEDLNKIFFKSLIYSMGINICIVIAVQMSLGIEFARHINFPFMTFTRLVNLGQTIQGFESLYIISWIMGNVVKISGYLYFTTIAIKEVTGKDNQNFIIPVSLAIFIAVLLIKDKRAILATFESTQRIILILSFIAIIVIPSIMLIVYLFRRKSLGKGNE
ncbi:MAG: endospore germination permease [Tissierellia bacterium]|nr:endospore germination permease [Tissierellia bacterium]